MMTKRSAVKLKQTNIPNASFDAQVRIRGEVHRLIAPRDQKHQSNFVEVRPF